MCEKLWKWKIFMHFLTLFYVSVLTSVSADYATVISVSASVSADMKIRYIGGYRYRPIWKNAYRSPTSVSVLIAIFLFIISKVCKKNATLDPRIFLFIFINPYIVTLINVSKQCVARWFSLGVCFWKKISILVRRNIWKKLINTPPLDTPWSLLINFSNDGLE